MIAAPDEGVLPLAVCARAGQRRVSFKYDPFGRRIYKSSSSGTSIFAYDGETLIEETNASGAAVARYAELFPTDEPLAELRSSTTSYYEQDGPGSTSPNPQYPTAPRCGGFSCLDDR